MATLYVTAQGVEVVESGKRRWSDPHWFRGVSQPALRGMEAMNMICKGQVQGIDKGNVRAQIKFVSQIFGVVA